MSDLERDLRELAPRVAFPETPDVASAVAARLTPAPAPGRRRPARRRAAAAVGLAVLAAAGTVAAVPPARRATLDLLGLRGATLARVERLPAVPPARRPLRLGTPVALAGVAALAPVPALVPAALGPPERVAVRGRGPGATVALAWAPRGDLPRSAATGLGALLLVARGSGDAGFAGKLAGPGTRVEAVWVGGAPGAWVSGAPHVVAFQGPGGRLRGERPRLAGDTLLWNRGDLILRLESRLPRDQAVRVAESIP